MLHNIIKASAVYIYIHVYSWFFDDIMKKKIPHDLKKPVKWKSHIISCPHEDIALYNSSYFCC